MRGSVYLFMLAVFCISLSTDFVMVRPAEGNQGKKLQTCIASYVSNKLHGRKTASGEVYDKNKLTAAHRTYPLGTMVEITNLRNGKSVELKINDRGPFIRGRGLDVSYRAARELGFVRHGKTPVQIKVLK